jgi:hypothetical protein
MKPIITNAAFVGDYYVANPTSPVMAAQLNNIVKINQEAYLRELLGPLYYNDFASWFDANTRPANPTYEALLTGATFKTVQQSIDMYMPPISRPITAFCYSAWNSRNATQTVAMGEVETDSQNATHNNAVIKVVDRWNEMVSDSIATWEYLNKQLLHEANWISWKYQSKRYYTNGIFVKKNRFDL